MKNLTSKQQQIIDNLTAEFNRINSFAKMSSGFNLIDIEPLKRKSEEIKQNKLIAEQDAKMWRQIAMDEAERIAKLLQEDLPFACVERYGKSNGHCDLPSVCIQREKGRSGHHENFVAIDVLINTEYEYQTHECSYHKGIGLSYRHEYVKDKCRYSSIEELFEKSTIKEEIRTKILNRITNL
jgi:hypothetical protein